MSSSMKYPIIPVKPTEIAIAVNMITRVFFNLTDIIADFTLKG